MTELGPNARAFLDSCKDADDPSTPELRENRQRTLARVGAAAAAGMAATVSTKASAAGLAAFGMFGAGKVAVGVVVVAMAGGGGVLAVRALDPPTSARGVRAAPARTGTDPGNGSRADHGAPVGAVAVSSTAVGALVAPPMPSDDTSRADPEPRTAVKPRATAGPPAAATATPVLPAPSLAATTQPRASSSPDSVAAEVAQLRDARLAMSGGDSEKALEILERHGSDNPVGVLAEERAAMRVVALCQSGKLVEGRSAAARFLAEHPQSPLAGRVKSACPSP